MSTKRHQGRDRHAGPDHSSPYPVSRLAPTVELVDLAREIARADDMLNIKASAKLRVIADQVKALQAEAMSVLEEAKRDRELHRAKCHFERRPGMTYHLYRRDDGSDYFSLLSPREWGAGPPHEFLGSYRLENDMSWTPAEEVDEPDEAAALVDRLLLGHSTK